ncbi:MAG: hypothetical protein JO356_01100 [Acidobacteria bacterium]|nr:hypothetical protein [Acidobacteriota bacterium]
MNVGMVGCGKLGLMVALSIESRGHWVRGYDISAAPKQYLLKREIPFKEAHSEELLRKTQMEMVSLEELCQWADILFLAPQTPHIDAYEGATPLPDTRADFNYDYLVECVREVNRYLIQRTPCVVISTVLPGTIEREVLPIIGAKFDLVYSPQFIAMGTVYNDFLNPEFWLIGARSPAAATLLAHFYETICYGAPALKTDIRTAEGIKVLYNTFITAKTVLANLYGEMAHRCGMKVDDIYRALELSTRRLISTKYLKAGMGDGGGCHPRDNIALSWLARNVNLSYDFFESLMVAREKHCEFLADLVEEYRWQVHQLPVVILGRAFKPETNIDTGSPARLLSFILKRRGVAHSCTEDKDVTKAPHLVFIGCQHERYTRYQFAPGSIVIDPFRYMPDVPGVEVIRIGEGERRGVLSSKDRALQSAALLDPRAV